MLFQKYFTGQYIYFESSTPARARAVLSSPLIKARQSCLQFSYHMRGDHTMGRLKVIKVSRGISTVLWKKSGNQGNRLHRHSINVQNAMPYKVKGMKITLTRPLERTVWN